MEIKTDPLLVGATRPTTMWGISYEAIILCATVSSFAFLAFNNVFLLPVVYIPMHGITFLMCLKDPRAFRLLALWAQTKLRSTSWQFWGAATAAPTYNTRQRKGRGIQI